MTDRPVIDTQRMGGPAQLSSEHITTSTRDPDALGQRIGTWLAGHLGAGSSPVVHDVVKPDGNGMSSETILFSATWDEDGESLTERFVARIEPELDKLPVFPSYDLQLQHRAMALVGESTAVPVPAARWYEPDPAVIGSPFFVMERIDGEVPRDVLPYTFPDPNFVIDATDEQRATMQRSAVTVLAGIHEITPASRDLSFLEYDQPGVTALERHLAHWEDYLAWVTAEQTSPLLEECFAWLRANVPADAGAPRLSWGDARIGNMMFADHQVVAVLDWEMAGVAPPEVDLGWMAYLHRFFQDLTTDLGAPGLPDFMRDDALAATYEEVSGRNVGDLRWHQCYAAMRHGVIMRRVTERQVLHGEAIRPPDPDDMIIHRATLRAMLDGTYF